MNSLKALVAGCALAMTVAAPCSAAVVSGRSQAAYPGGVGRVDLGPGPAGRSSFRSDSRSRFVGAAGGWGFAHGGDGAGWRSAYGHRHGWRGRGWAAGYYGDDIGYPYAAADYEDFGNDGPGPFGPQPPYGDSFTRGYGPMAVPLASALAPMTYGPGAHDGAYTYGYAGYAQTPALPPQVGSADGWWVFPGPGRCGC